MNLYRFALPATKHYGQVTFTLSTSLFLLQAPVNAEQNEKIRFNLMRSVDLDRILETTWLEKTNPSPLLFEKIEVPDNVKGFYQAYSEGFPNRKLYYNPSTGQIEPDLPPPLTYPDDPNLHALSSYLRQHLANGKIPTYFKDIIVIRQNPTKDDELWQIIPTLREALTAPVVSLGFYAYEQAGKKGQIFYEALGSGYVFYTEFGNVIVTNVHVVEGGENATLYAQTTNGQSVSLAGQEVHQINGRDVAFIGSEQAVQALVKQLKLESAKKVKPKQNTITIQTSVLLTNRTDVLGSSNPTTLFSPTTFATYGKFTDMSFTDFAVSSALLGAKSDLNLATTGLLQQPVLGGTSGSLALSFEDGKVSNISLVFAYGIGDLKPSGRDLLDRLGVFDTNSVGGRVAHFFSFFDEGIEISALPVIPNGVITTYRVKELIDRVQPTTLQNIEQIINNPKISLENIIAIIEIHDKVLPLMNPKTKARYENLTHKKINASANYVTEQGLSELDPNSINAYETVYHSLQKYKYLSIIQAWSMSQRYYTPEQLIRINATVATVRFQLLQQIIDLLEKIQKESNTYNNGVIQQLNNLIKQLSL